ncbi:hypothetical protein BJP40_19240 [Streptomyces sp. CC53]|nr:hypothetical protein BJP40_19240 [Streptomyces sp. CC53]
MYCSREWLYERIRRDRRAAPVVLPRAAARCAPAAPRTSPGTVRAGTRLRKGRAVVPGGGPAGRGVPARAGTGSRPPTAPASGRRSSRPS